MSDYVFKTLLDRIPKVFFTLMNLSLFCVCLKGTNIKDVVLPESAPSTLLLDKHIAFIISYSKKTDDYVCTAMCL